MRKREHFYTHFYEVNITLISKAEKDIIRQEFDMLLNINIIFFMKLANKIQ